MGSGEFGFPLRLPIDLTGPGVHPLAASALRASSAIHALPCPAVPCLPGIGMANRLHHRWSSFESLELFLVLAAAALLVSGVPGATDTRSALPATLAAPTLPARMGGVIAMRIPRAAGIHLLRLRGTGPGVIAASSKFGGIPGAGPGASGFVDRVLLPALFPAVPMGGLRDDAQPDRRGHPGPGAEAIRAAIATRGVPTAAGHARHAATRQQVLHGRQ